MAGPPLPPPPPGGGGGVPPPGPIPPLLPPPIGGLLWAPADHMLTVTRDVAKTHVQIPTFFICAISIPSEDGFLTPVPWLLAGASGAPQGGHTRKLAAPSLLNEGSGPEELAL